MLVLRMRWREYWCCVNKGSRLAVKHLDPLRSLVPPADVHELRRVLGLFVVSRKCIKDYAVLTKPLTDLLKGKAVTFVWKEKQQAAFDFVRDKLLAGVHLAAPNFDLPFHLATDASEDGKGGELYQLPTVPIAEQYPYCPKLHAPDNHAVIFFISRRIVRHTGLSLPSTLKVVRSCGGRLNANTTPSVIAFPFTCIPTTCH
jgi:hypothetical protein